MSDMPDVIALLTDKNASAACDFAAELMRESRESDRWYGYVDSFAGLLEHKNSLVRNRALWLLAANARWDSENRYEAFIDRILAHIADEKPITARQCIQALPELVRAKPQLKARVRQALVGADFSGCRDSMRPLLLKDIEQALASMDNIG